MKGTGIALKVKIENICFTVKYSRAGPHCEICQDNHYISPVKDAFGRQPCEQCDCDPTGMDIHILHTEF